MPQFAKLHNLGPAPFDFHYHNEKRIIEPGGDAIVPWDLATTLFGDPSAVDLPRNPDRTLTFKRIRNLYGYLEGMEHTAEVPWEERMPHIEVYDLETSKRVYMVLEDPQGIHAVDAPQAQAQSEIEMLTRQIASLTQTVNALLAQRTSEPEEASGQVVVPSVDAPTPDFPEQVLPTSVPRPPKNNPRAPKNILGSGTSDKTTTQGGTQDPVTLDLSQTPEEPTVDGPTPTPVLPPR